MGLINTIFGAVSVALPGLKKLVEVFANKKRYTREEIAAKAKAEADQIQTWKDQARKDRELAFGKEQ